MAEVNGALEGGERHGLVAAGADDGNGEVREAFAEPCCAPMTDVVSHFVQEGDGGEGGVDQY